MLNRKVDLRDLSSMQYLASTREKAGHGREWFVRVLGKVLLDLERAVGALCVQLEGVAVGAEGVDLGQAGATAWRSEDFCASPARIWLIPAYDEPRAALIEERGNEAGPWRRSCGQGLSPLVDRALLPLRLEPGDGRESPKSLPCCQRPAGPLE